MIALSPTASPAGEAPHTLVAACGIKPGVACHIMWDLSHNHTAATLVAGYLAGPIDVVLRVAFVVLLALLVRMLTHRLITRLTTRAAEASGLGRRRVSSATTAEGSQLLFTERRQNRTYALGSILRSIASAVIVGIAGIMILGDLGLNLAPVLASAGVLGLAVGFGAQSLIRDLLSGIFMLVEDQYGVGDVIDVGEASGTVEAVGLRITRLRDANGVVWHVRNGTIDRVGNESQSWSRVVVDVPIGYDQNIPRVREIMKQTAVAMWGESQWQEIILAEPEVWGVEAMSGSAIVMRVVAKTLPLRHGQVARELRERLKAEFDGNHVALAIVDGADSRSVPRSAETYAGENGD